MKFFLCEFFFFLVEIFRNGEFVIICESNFVGIFDVNNLMLLYIVLDWGEYGGYRLFMFVLY